MAAGGGRDAVVGLDRAPLVGGDHVEVDDPEAGELLSFAVVEDLEVVRTETPHGFAAAGGDVHRHLDLEDEGPVLELTQVVRLLGRSGHGGQEQTGQSADRESPVPQHRRRLG